MSDPVNLFEVEGDRFPVSVHVLPALMSLKLAFEATWPALELLGRHIGETEMGSNHDGTAITDQEMAFHHLALQQMEATIDELRKKCAQITVLSERRMWTALTNRGSMGMIVWGKSFGAEGELIPKMPKTDAIKHPEEYAKHVELMDWCRENGYAEYIKPEHIGFQAMQKILDDRARNKLQRPPHVDVSPDTGIKVGR